MCRCNIYIDDKAAKPMFLNYLVVQNYVVGIRWDQHNFVRALHIKVYNTNVQKWIALAWNISSFLILCSLKHNVLNNTVVTGGSTLYHINLLKMLSRAPHLPYLTMSCSSMYRITPTHMTIVIDYWNTNAISLFARHASYHKLSEFSDFCAMNPQLQVTATISAHP